ncbi:MAG: redoxin domain-containing protein [Acidimicrobiia bacterium]
MNIGEPIEDFERPDDEGRPWRLRDQRGRPVVLVFHRHLY